MVKYLNESKNELDTYAQIIIKNNQIMYFLILFFQSTQIFVIIMITRKKNDVLNATECV